MLTRISIMLRFVGSLLVTTPLWISAGCCLEISGSAAGTSAGLGIGSGGTGGKVSNTSGGSSSGGPIVPDAGTCRIDRHTVAGGTWLDLKFGSCTRCDPSSNPTDWTELDSGVPCEGFLSRDVLGPRVVPFAGSCLQGVESRSFCTCAEAGGPCVGDFACCGGYCNENGLCVITENLGYPSACGLGLPTAVENACVVGPCCLDAGWLGVRDGGGWCCGLVDGGVRFCLDAGQVCYEASDCCAGLSCVDKEAVFDGGAGYGFCEPD